MRALRIALAALLGMAAALVGAPAAFAASATLTLDPNHGSSRSRFTATYHFQPTGLAGCAVGRTNVQFAWDGTRIGQARLNPRTCSVRVRVEPPRDDRGAGPHTLAAALTISFGSQASAVYTIDGAGGPLPTPTRSPTVAPTQGLPADSAAPAPTDALAGGDPVVASSPALAANQQPAAVTGALIFGGLLAAVGAGVLVMVFVRMRRVRPDE